MKRTLTGLTIFIILFGLVLLSKISQFFFDAMLLAALFFAVYEMIKLGRASKYQITIVPIVLTAVASYPMIYFFGLEGLLITFGVGFLLTFSWYVFDTKIDINGFLFSVLLLIYPISLFSLSFVLIHMPYGDKSVGMLPFLIAMGAPMCSDTFAFYFGSLIKGAKIFPKISPKKTYSGCIAGLFGGVAGALIAYFLFEFLKLPINAPLMFSEYLKLDILFYCLVGLGLSVISQIGDLAASRIKRCLNIKDFSHALGAHGGVMDRIDSVMFSLVFMTIVMMFLV